MLTTIHEVNQRMRQRMPSAAKSCAPWLVLAGSLLPAFAYADDVAERDAHSTVKSRF